MKFRRILLGLFVCCISIQELDAQKPFVDAMSWLSLSLDQKIQYRWSVKLLTRFRSGENFTQLNSWYSDLGVQYDVTDRFTLTANYVYAPSRLSNMQFVNFHQYYTSLNYKFKPIKRWNFDNRIIIQRTSSGSMLDSGDPSKNSVDIRYKPEVDFKFGKGYTAFVADEVMLPLSSVPFELERNRFYAGINRVFTKRINMDFYFVLQSSYHSSSGDNRYYIYGIDLNYKFRRLVF